MRVLVLLELGADVRIPPERDSRSGRVRDEWLVRETDPGSARALDLALTLKAARPGAEVTAIHFGPPEREPWLRRASARGCDRMVRVWEEEWAGVHAPGKAVILAGAAQALGFDLVLTGAEGVIDGSGQLGTLLAAHLSVPCVARTIEVGLVGPSTGAAGPDAAAAGSTAAGGLGGGAGPSMVAAGTSPGAAPGGDPAPPAAADDAECLLITRALDEGFRERVEALLPIVATVAAEVSVADSASPGLSAAALLAAHKDEILVWDLADLGVPHELVRQAEYRLHYGRPCPRRPRLRPLAAPDSSLPAFDRILELVRGTVKTRESRVVQEPSEDIVDEIFNTLRDEGWLDHLRRPHERRDSTDPNAGDAP